jgi:hypothetical protein
MYLEIYDLLDVGQVEDALAHQAFVNPDYRGGHLSSLKQPTRYSDHTPRHNGRTFTSSCMIVVVYQG